MNFFVSPKGDLLNTSRIGGVRAVETGLLILGTGADELLEFVDCSGKVAERWRNALAEMLVGQRPGRRPTQPDWNALAIEADPSWARQKNLISQPVTPKA